MHVVTSLRGFGQFPSATSASSRISTASVPKSDYIKQLQCLLNIAVTMPEAVTGFGKSKTLWQQAQAWTYLPIDGVLKKGSAYGGDPSWDGRTEADTIMMLGAAGVPQFQTLTRIGPSDVDAYLTTYIQAALTFIGGRENPGNCDFPAQTKARLDAEAAARTAAEAAARAAAEERARREAEAAAIAAAKLAAEAAAAAEADAAAKAAEIARQAAEVAATDKARAAAEAAAQAAAQAAAAQQQQQQPSAGARPEVVSPSPSTTPTALMPRFSLSPKGKIAVGVGLLVAIGAGVVYGAHRARR